MWSIWQDSLPVLQSCTCLWAYSKLNIFCPESNKPPPDLKRQMISCCLLVYFSVQLRCRNLLHPLLISTEVRETNHQMFPSSWENIRPSSYKIGHGPVRAAGAYQCQSAGAMVWQTACKALKSQENSLRPFGWELGVRRELVQAGLLNAVISLCSVCG